MPQLSVAAGVINDADGLAGLHPAIIMEAVPVTVGTVLSLVNVIVCVCVPVLPQASVTVQVFVTDTEQPVTTSG